MQKLVNPPGAIDSQVHFREPGLTYKEDISCGTMGGPGGITLFLKCQTPSRRLQIKKP